MKIFKFLNAQPIFCIGCGETVPLLTNADKQRCVLCGYTLYGELIHRGDIIKVFNGGHISCFILKCIRFLTRKIPSFSVYVRRKYLYIYINTRTVRERCFGKPSRICNCRLCDFEIRIFKFYREYTLGRHWCNIYFYPNARFYERSINADNKV
jgi:hypothetical protein